LTTATLINEGSSIIREQREDELNLKAHLGQRTVFKKFLLLLMDPPAFFEMVRNEDWKPALIFFLEISFILSIFTAIANYLGVESTDFSSAYQSQILAYRILKDNLLAQYGVYAYLLEVPLILGFAVLTKSRGGEKVFTEVFLSPLP